MKSEYFSEGKRVARAIYGLCAVLAALQLTNCGGDSNGEEGEEEEVLKSFRTALNEYNDAVDMVVYDFERISLNLPLISEAMNAEDWEEAGRLIKEQDYIVGETLDELKKAEAADNMIQGNFKKGLIAASSKGVKTLKYKVEPITVTVAATTFAVTGLLTYCGWLKSKSKEAIEKQKEVEDAFFRMGTDPDDKDTHAEYLTKKGEHIAIHQEVLSEMGSRIMTANLPGNPKTVAAVILKEVATDMAQDGAKVLFSSKECRTNANSSSCKLGAAVSDDEGKVSVLPGELDMSVTKKGFARVAVPSTKVAENETKEVPAALIPVEEATPEKVEKNDKGEYIPSEEGDDDDNDDSGGGSGKDYYVMCSTVDNGINHFACIRYTGSVKDLENEEFTQAMSQCISADYKRYNSYYESDAACRKACADKLSGYGDNRCDTP